MPIYEYQCKNCGHALEKLQKVNDAPLTDCPSCQQADLVKLVSAAGFKLKGTGWYETDFKGDKNVNTSKPANPVGSSSEVKAEATSEKKSSDVDKSATA